MIKTVFHFSLLVMTGILSVAGCGDDEVEPVDFLAANPPNNSKLQTDATITVIFDGVPDDIDVNPGDATINGHMVAISGPFPVLCYIYRGHLTNTIDGLVFGLSKRVSGYLNFVVGYSLIRGKELSPGFQQSASQLIKKIDLQKYPNYERFKGFKPDGSRAKQKLLDGLSLMEPGTKEKILSG